MPHKSQVVSIDGVDTNEIIFHLVRNDLHVKLTCGWDEEHSVTLKQSMNFQFVCEMKGNTAYCTLSQVNIYQKPDTRKSLFATPPLYLSHLLLMFGQKQTEMEPMQGEHTEGPVYSELPCSAFGSFHGSTRCATVSCHCRIRWLASDMARLALPVLLVLCFSLLHFSSGRLSRTRKAVSPRQSGGNNGS